MVFKTCFESCASSLKHLQLLSEKGLSLSQMAIFNWHQSLHQTAINPFPVGADTPSLSLDSLQFIATKFEIFGITVFKNLKHILYFLEAIRWEGKSFSFLVADSGTTPVNLDLD